MEDWNLLRHRMRDGIRHGALRQLEARRPHTFVELADTIHKRACTARLEQQDGALSVLRRLVTGATGAALMVGKQGMHGTQLSLQASASKGD